MKSDKAPESYSPKVAAARFKAALRGALSTPPQPLKDIPKKVRESKRKAKAAKKATKAAP